tara:strand:+ start:103 stop:294 length:192 start_codon:yes stop_codon:yes gene_type:complete
MANSLFTYFGHWLFHNGEYRARNSFDAFQDDAREMINALNPNCFAYSRMRCRYACSGRLRERA